MKILITGGHLAPALAIIDEWKKKHNSKEIVFVGRKYINNFERTLSLEYQEITRKNIRFVSLIAGRLTRVLTLESILNLLIIPFGFLHAGWIIIKERPTVILSFGGYLALPIAFWAFITGIPIFTHEQTINPGIANRVIGFFAKKVFVAFKQAASYFNKNKVIITGNPVREAIFKVIKRPFNVEKNRPVIYITGGSLGSHSINQIIKTILPTLLKKYTIIHQTGDTEEYHDFEDLISLREKLHKILQKNYFPKKFFFEDEMGYIYLMADMVISRAGANTFFELIALRKPTIFIPLPWSSGREQELQAKIFKENGIGEIFYQGDNIAKLIQLIDKMIIKKEQYKKNFEQLTFLYKKNAAQIIISEILSSI